MFVPLSIYQLMKLRRAMMSNNNDQSNEPTTYGKQWSDSEIKTMFDASIRGLSLKEATLLLPGRTTGALLAKMNQLVAQRAEWSNLRDQFKGMSKSDQEV